MADKKKTDVEGADRGGDSGSGNRNGDGNGNGNGNRSGDGNGNGEHQASLLERIVGLAGALIVLGVIGFMLYEAIWGERSPPDIEVELVHVVPSGDDYLAEIRVENRGGDTAMGVTVTGRLLQPGTPEAEAESATATIDYVPPESTVRAGLFFDTRPSAGTLELGADGYVRP